MNIRKKQAYIYRWLKQNSVQHLGFGLFVFLIIFCFFAIDAWYQGKVASLESLAYRRQAFAIVFKESVIYSLLMAPPVYFNLAFIYKGKGLKYVNGHLLRDGDLKGWGFYLLLLTNFLLAIVFALLYAPLLDRVLTLADQKWYQTVVIILLLVICSTGVSFTKETIEKNRELERLERRNAIRLRREAERKLQLIKKQIRPHFLFNTLANLQILAQKKSDELPALIGELSRLLRYLVYGTNEQLVLLEEEMNFIEGYLELQNLQLGKGTDFQFTRRGEMKLQHRIAPMILIQFIENCFKHYNRKGEGPKFIHILMDIKEDNLHVLIENSYKPFARNEDNFQDTKEKGGLGIVAATENLKLVYKDKGQLEVTSENNVHSVRLKIPLL